MSERRVVVTGMGCVTPLGTSLESTWEQAVAGSSACRTITRFDPAELPVRIAAEVRGDLDYGDISPKEVRRYDPVVLYALAAAREAIADAGFEGADLTRAGTSIGSGIGGLTTIVDNDRAFLRAGARRVSPFTIPMTIANMPGGVVSIQHGLKGPNLCHVSACATGAHSIGEAARTIEHGDAEIMVVGGVEAPLLDIGIASFAAMRALSLRNDEPESASRPFDRGRDGFVMGEGAGILVLESLEHAQARGATVRAEVLGYGASADASHIAAPEESGDGALRCMRAAIADAGLSVDEIGAVNAHATSTPTGDPIEVAALRSVFGQRLAELPVSATKSMTGHLLGAAGAVEAILSIRALETGLLPPTINLVDEDPDCVLDHVRDKARPAQVESVLSNSFGFGGTNAALVFGHANRV